MSNRYHMWADLDGKHEVHFNSDNLEELKIKAKGLIKKGYFVFLEDNETGTMREIKF